MDECNLEKSLWKQLDLSYTEYCLNNIWPLHTTSNKWYISLEVVWHIIPAI